MSDIKTMKPDLLLGNLISDIHDSADPQYWNQAHVDEFLAIIATGSAKDLLAWLLAIGIEDIDSYVQDAGTDDKASNGLPKWMTRFKPSYIAYQQLLNGLETVADPDLDAFLDNTDDTELEDLVEIEEVVFPLLVEQTL
jgi:hypothetical protein